MKRRMLMNTAIIPATWLLLTLAGLQTSEAVQEHHKPGAGTEGPASTEPPVSGTLPDPGVGDSSEMGAMTGGPDDERDPEMMGMMGYGMMRIMMSHLMGGPGGMGRMMGQMGPGMMGQMRPGKMGCMGPGMMGHMGPGMMGQMGHGMMGRMGPGMMGQMGPGMMGRMAPGKMGREAVAGGMGPMARMLDNLDLTPEQWEQVRTLAREQLGKMVDLWAQRMKQRIVLASLRWDKEVDPRQVKEVFVQEAEAEAEMFLAGFEYLRGLKAILTPEQLEKLEIQGL